MNTQTQAYLIGWQACYASKGAHSEANPYPEHTTEAYKWSCGFLDAMETLYEGKTPEQQRAEYVKKLSQSRRNP